MIPTIASPLRLLLLSPPGTPCPSFLQDVSTHEIHTAYYSASIPIWRDELPTSSDDIDAWKTEWMASEAKEVVDAIGAWMICFSKPREKTDLDTIRRLLKTISEVVEYHTCSSYDTSEPLLLAVGMRQSVNPTLEFTVEEWENLCGDCGKWEWIDGENEITEERVPQRERNEFGEKIGLERLKEALEVNEWRGSEAGDDSVRDDLSLEDGFGGETAEMEKELVGLMMALNGDDLGRDDSKNDKVQEMENMMLKMQAVKDMGTDMPEPERRKLAAKVVREVMESL